MKPAGLADFWKRTKEELAKTELNASLEEAPDLSGTWGPSRLERDLP